MAGILVMATLVAGAMVGARAQPPDKAAILMDAFDGELGPGDREIDHHYADDYLIHFERGKTTQIFLDSAEFVPLLQILSLEGPAVGREIDRNGASGDHAFLSFTSSESGYYVVRASSSADRANGRYSLRTAVAP